MRIIPDPELVSELTRLNPFDRFPDGRPWVPDEYLQRLRKITTEQAWAVLRRHDYNFQFEANWFHTHPDKILVGRAVTTQFIPYRPDYHELVEEVGQKEGHIGGQNSWVIDTLRENDVMVVDLAGKVVEGTFVGDNLSTSLQTRTRTGGAIIDGGIRDFQGVAELKDIAIFCRGLDPTPIRNLTFLSLNMPMRLGQATVMPGDVVLGTPTGVIFIPPHLIQEVVEHGENIRVRDYFGKLRLSQGIYTPGEIDRKWSDEIEADFEKWKAEQDDLQALLDA